MNHAGGLKKNLIVVLNDNKMSICPRVGGLAESLDRLRTNTFYTGLKTEVQRLLNRVPVIGDPVERFLNQVKGAIKAGLVGGMFFEELGFRYVGPVDGHNIHQLQKYLAMVRQVSGPVLLHVVTEKGHGFQPAAEDPTSFHTPEPFARKNGSAMTAEEEPPPVVHLRGAGSNLRADAARPPRRRDHRGDVPGDHARTDSRGIPRPLLRRRHLRVARRGLRRRFGQVGNAAAGQHLQHLHAACLRPDLPGSRPAKPPGHAAPGSRRPGRPRRPHPSRRLRPDLPAPPAEPRRHGAGRSGGPRADDPLGDRQRKAGGDPLSRRPSRKRSPANRPRSNWALRKSSLGGATACWSPAARR